MVLLVLLGVGCRSPLEAGQAALDAHDLAAAEGAYRRALAQAPDDPAALAGLGWTYALAGQHSAAAATFERCTLVLPEAAECWRGQASVALAQDNVPRARELLGKAVALAPEDPRVQSSQALLELASGDASSAEGRYRALVERYPQDAEYRLGLARVLLQQGADAAALEVTEQALAQEGAALRYRSMLWVTQARALLASTSGREDPQRCAETVPDVLRWLDAADQSLDNAEATGVTPPELARVRRQVARRRGLVQDQCPGVGSGR